MAQYPLNQLVSASNATYVTNTSGSITAANVRGLNETWISSSALLTGSNTFNGDQLINGGLEATNITSDNSIIDLKSDFILNSDVTKLIEAESIQTSMLSYGYAQSLSRLQRFLR